jgi:hypothetical protein
MRRKWSTEEDESLVRLVGTHGKQWGVIASQMVSRSPSQIAARWQKCLDPKLIKGPFQPDEDQIITDYVHKHRARDWPGLCEILCDRSPKQCRERWLNHLSPEISIDPWTEEEDLIIFENYSKLGGKWSIISQWLPGRTDNAIKTRWNSSIAKRIQTDRNGRRILAPDLGKKVKPTPKIKPPPIRIWPPPPGPIVGGEAEQSDEAYTPTMAMGSPFKSELRIGSPFAGDCGAISPFLSPSTPQGIFTAAFGSNWRGGAEKDGRDWGPKANSEPEVKERLPGVNVSRWEVQKGEKDGRSRLRK